MTKRQKKGGHTINVHTPVYEAIGVIALHLSLQQGRRVTLAKATELLTLTAVQGYMREDSISDELRQRFEDLEHQLLQ